MSQRMINDNFWTDRWVEELDPSEKLVYLYLLTNPLCNVAGAYEIHTKRIAYETGFDRSVVENILKRFENDNKIIRYNDYIIIINFIKNQALKNPNIYKGIVRIRDGLPKGLLLSLWKALKGFERTPYPTLLNLTINNISSNEDNIIMPEGKKENSGKKGNIEKYGNDEVNAVIEAIRETVEAYQGVYKAWKMERPRANNLAKKHGDWGKFLKSKNLDLIDTIKKITTYSMTQKFCKRITNASEFHANWASVLNQMRKDLAERQASAPINKNVI